MTDDGSGNVRGDPGRHEAAETGVLAYVAGFALAHLAGRIVRTTSPTGMDGGPSAGTIAQGPEAAGSVLYSAHFLTASPWPGWYSTNVLLDPGIALPGSPVPRVAWFLLPAALVALGGYVLCERGDARERRARTAIRRGSRIAYGYLPPFLLVGVLFSGALDLLLVVLVVGVVYSVVLGGIGGYLSYLLSRRESRRLQ